ncbi:hypothetical protein CEXT_771951 [Caerostris extrusa]|uniref:Uncharacterized protein n=1 Tax=Caerostris extrusa TaxID=172846 RepID=A0AAV4UMY6_CAEEX|nr:hypothetical protein CEXT_771951 [Caerostris extrusa]
MQMSRKVGYRGDDDDDAVGYLPPLGGYLLHDGGDQLLFIDANCETETNRRPAVITHRLLSGQLQITVSISNSGRFFIGFHSLCSSE